MTKEKTQVEDSLFACPGWLGCEADLHIRWKMGNMVAFAWPRVCQWSYFYTVSRCIAPCCRKLKRGTGEHVATLWTNFSMGCALIVCAETLFSEPLKPGEASNPTWVSRQAYGDAREESFFRFMASWILYLCYSMQQIQRAPTLLPCSLKLPEIFLNWLAKPYSIISPPESHFFWVFGTLAGTPEGDWIEVHELLQESFPTSVIVVILIQMIPILIIHPIVTIKSTIFFELYIYIHLYIYTFIYIHTLYI